MNANVRLMVIMITVAAYMVTPDLASKGIWIFVWLMAIYGAAWFVDWIKR